MKKILIIDISGRVVNYDIMLAESLCNYKDYVIVMFVPSKINHSSQIKFHQLFTFIPKKYKTSESIIKKYVKILEGISNYLYLFLYLIIHKANVIHIQWMPFLERSIIEKYLIKFFKFILPSVKLVFTIHNIYPHDTSYNSIIQYRKRFKKIVPLYDKFIVHTNNTKKEVIQEFNIPKEKVEIVHHGIFIPKNFVVNDLQEPAEEWNFIMYGIQSYYKGTDVFVNALKKLPNEIKSKVKATICGRIDNNYYNQLISINSGVDINWIPYYVDDINLYSLINTSNVIILPYRSISQSGVLLLALSFKKMIITSDLPSFKETLTGFDENMFFKNEDSEDLARLIVEIVNKKIDYKKQLYAIENLNQKYSWEEAASKTIEIYNSLC